MALVCGVWTNNLVSNSLYGAPLAKSDTAIQEVWCMAVRRRMALGLRLLLYIVDPYAKRCIQSAIGRDFFPGAAPIVGQLL